jgi:amino acid transporter
MAVTTAERSAPLRRELRIWEGIGLSVAGASPALAMAFSGPGVAGLVGRAAALSFLIAAVTCIFIGYAFMLLARKYNSAGSVYGFVGASLGPRSGFFAGWSLLLMYFVFTPGSAAASGYFTATLFNDLGWWHNASFIWFAIPISVIIWLTSAGLARHSTRALLTIESITVVLILILMAVVLIKVGTGHGLNHGTLTLNIFVPPSGVNLHAIFLGAVFGFLAFTGFEAAGALGEETVNPGREIPRAIGVSILAVAIFYVACIGVQSLGFGANTAGSAQFAASSGPLFQLSGSYLNDAVRDVILVGAAFSAFGAAVSEAMAGSRLLFALSRDGTPSSPLARIALPSGAPRRAVELIIAINVILLLAFQFAGVSGFSIWQYLGTLGTLSILVGYALVCIGASRAALNGSLQVAKWRGAIPALAAILVGYTLYNQLVPAPAWPFKLFPYLALGWLLIGAAVVVFAPRLATRMGDGLVRTLGLTKAGGALAAGRPGEPGPVEPDTGGLDSGGAGPAGADGT